MNDVENGLRNFILTTLREDAPAISIDPSDNLLESGVIDSMGVLEIATFIEETYGPHIEDEEISLENFQSLTSIAALVARKLS